MATIGPIQNYVIAVGGTGVRCIESLIHLCAAGMGPERMMVFIVDADSAHGNVTHLRTLVTDYQKIRDSLQIDKPEFFHTEIVKPEGNITWSPFDLFPSTTKLFKYLLNYDDLSDVERDVCSVLFTEGELAMDLAKGFRGHTCVGSTSLALMEQTLDKDPWADILGKIKNDLGVGREVRVFVCGSIFGGTGASGIPTIGKILDQNIQKGRDKFRLGATLILPYFSFNPSEEDVKRLASELYIKADDLLLNSRAALEHYALVWANGLDSPYHDTYFLGDNQPLSQEFSEGGPEQNNKFHYVELLSALAADHFFKSQVDDMSRRKRYHANPRQPDYAAKDNVGNTLTSNRVDWEDLPLGGDGDIYRRKLLYFTILGYAYIDFFHKLLDDPGFENKPRCIPWLVENFDIENLRSLTEQEKQKRLGTYFTDYYINWLKQIHESGNVQLFSGNALDQSPAERLVSLLPVGEEKYKKTPFKRLWNSACEDGQGILGTGTGKLISLIYNAVVKFSNETYHLKGK